MKKSVGLYFNNSKLEYKKIELVKRIGFDEFFSDIYDEGEDLSLKQQCEFGKSLGLNCTMIHCLYNEPDLHYFWEIGDNGDEICEKYCNQIRLIKGLTKNFVVHLNANKNQKQSLIGIERIRQMLSVCDQCDINLCIENLYSETEIPYIFNNIKHEKLKICFDTGHKHFLTPNFEVIKNFYKYVEVLHMHDNHGKSDEHLICGRGNIDWKNFAKELRVIPNIVLSCEARSVDADMDEFLREVYNSLTLIEQYMCE